MKVMTSSPSKWHNRTEWPIGWWPRGPYPGLMVSDGTLIQASSLMWDSAYCEVSRTSMTMRLVSFSLSRLYSCVGVILLSATGAGSAGKSSINKTHNPGMLKCGLNSESLVIHLTCSFKHYFFFSVHNIKLFKVLCITERSYHANTVKKNLSMNRI